MEERSLDGQMLLFPSEEEWEEIVRTRAWSSVRLVPLLRVGDMLQVVSSHAPALQLVLCRKERVSPHWAPLYLLRIGEENYRVRVVHTKCEQCSRVFSMADPKEPELYEGLEESHAVEARALVHPKLSCPSCGADLDQRLHPLYCLGEVKET
jgi:hypothetical protein